METPGPEHNYCATPDVRATEHNYCALARPDHNYCTTPGLPHTEHNYYYMQKQGVQDTQMQVETHPRLYVSGLQQLAKSSR